MPHHNAAPPCPHCGAPLYKLTYQFNEGGKKRRGDDAHADFCPRCKGVSLRPGGRLVSSSASSRLARPKPRRRARARQQRRAARRVITRRRKPAAPARTPATALRGDAASAHGKRKPKVPPSVAAEIVRRHKLGGKENTMRALAREFGVAAMTIHAVVHHPDAYGVTIAASP